MKSIILWILASILQRKTVFTFINVFTRPLANTYWKLSVTSESHSYQTQNNFSSVVSNLNSGTFFKLICGASNQDVPQIRNLCLLYTLGQVDCIDMSADISVIKAAIDGIKSANKIMTKMGTRNFYPLIMISVNDDEDPHFRKASFDPLLCPSSCPRPCEKVCPAFAIPSYQDSASMINNGVIEEKCYGCGRCLGVCPIGIITAKPYTVDRKDIRVVLSSGLAQAIEIHTRPGHLDYFQNLWNDIGDVVLQHVKLLSISFPDMGADSVPYMKSIQNIISSHVSWSLFSGVQVWQVDGRPMSGDIGGGTARASAQMAVKILNDLSNSTLDVQNKSNNGSISYLKHSDIILGSNAHYIQLAGGTNNYSASIAKDMGLIGSRGFGGFAFGGYARKRIGSVLQKLLEEFPQANLEDHDNCYEDCLKFTYQLVNSVRNN